MKSNTHWWETNNLALDRLHCFSDTIDPNLYGVHLIRVVLVFIDEISELLHVQQCELEVLCIPMSFHCGLDQILTK